MAFPPLLPWSVGGPAGLAQPPDHLFEPDRGALLAVAGLVSRESASGYKRTFGWAVIYVRFTPESGRWEGGRCMSAFDPKRTFADLALQPDWAFSQDRGLI